MMRRNILLIGTSCLAAAFPAYFAYQVVEWLGVGMLGLVIVCLAARVELESEGPVGHPRATGLYAASLQGRDRMSRSDRAERRAESAVRVRGARIAMVTGAVLIVLGGTGFLLS